MKTAEVCIKRIDNNVYLKKAICYVLRNPSLADHRILPWNHRWSSGGLYFNSGNMPEKEALTVSSVGVRKLRETFRTRFRLPDDLPVSEDGMICPQYHTDYKAVERLFGTSLSLLYFLSRNDRDRPEKSKLHRQRTEGIGEKHLFPEIRQAFRRGVECRKQMQAGNADMQTVRGRDKTGRQTYRHPSQSAQSIFKID